MSKAALVYEAAPAGYNQQQLGQTVVKHGNWYAIAAGQPDFPLGASGGAAGDYLESLTLIVATAATAAVSIKDGAGSAISILPNSPGGGIGVYKVPLDMASKSGAWKITTGAGVTAIAHGRFS